MHKKKQKLLSKSWVYKEKKYKNNIKCIGGDTYFYRRSRKF